MPNEGRYTPGRIAADVRRAIIRKIRAMKRQRHKDATSALIKLEQWIAEMDERALKVKGGIVRPWRPLRKIKGTGIKKAK